VTPLNFGYPTLFSIIGARVVGNVSIPRNVKSVHISSKGLKAFFNNRDYWIRINELNENCNL